MIRIHNCKCEQTQLRKIKPSNIPTYANIFHQTFVDEFF